MKNWILKVPENCAFHLRRNIHQSKWVRRTIWFEIHEKWENTNRGYKNGWIYTTNYNKCNICPLVNILIGRYIKWLNGPIHYSCKLKRIKFVFNCRKKEIMKTLLVRTRFSKSFISWTIKTLSQAKTVWMINNNRAADEKKNDSENSLKFDASNKKKINGGKRKNNNAPNVKQFWKMWNGLEPIGPRSKFE